MAGFFHVRPACAHSWRCESSRKLITTNEVKRNCEKATDRGEASVERSCKPMDKKDTKVPRHDTVFSPRAEPDTRAFAWPDPGEPGSLQGG